jgi:hypothetical protein
VQSHKTLAEIVSDTLKFKSIMNNTKLNWIKWIGVIPAAFGAYALSLLVVALISLLNHTDDKFSLMFWFQKIVPIVANAVGGYYFIIVGTTVAPNYKKITGLILLLIIVLISGILIYLLVMSKEYFKLAMSVAMVISATFAYIEVDDY